MAKGLHRLQQIRFPIGSPSTERTNIMSKNKKSTPKQAQPKVEKVKVEKVSNTVKPPSGPPKPMQSPKTSKKAAGKLAKNKRKS